MTQTLNKMLIISIIFMEISTTVCSGQAYHFSKGWLPGKRSYHNNFVELLQNYGDLSIPVDGISCRMMAGFIKYLIERYENTCQRDSKLKHDSTIMTSSMGIGE